MNPSTLVMNASTLVMNASNNDIPEHLSLFFPLKMSKFIQLNNTSYESKRIVFSTSYRGFGINLGGRGLYLCAGNQC